MALAKKPMLIHNKVSTILICSLLSCAISLIVFAVINSIDFVHFYMNDDFYIQNLLNGSMGEHYTYFVHSNAALSSVLAGLYSLGPAINWYGWFLFISLLGSSSVMGGVLMDKFGFGAGLCLYLISVPLMFGLFLSAFTYTLVCYALLASALICMVHGFYCSGKKTRLFLYVISALMLVVSMLLRKEVVVSAMVYTYALGLLFLIKYKKKAVSFLLVLAVSFGAVLCFSLADGAYYASSGELSSYKRFHEARINLVDHAPLDYSRYGEVFEGVGWSSLDVAMLYPNYTYPDDERFNVESMESIYEGMKSGRYNTNAAEIISDIVNKFHYSSNFFYVLLCLFVSAIVAFVSQRSKLFRVFTVVITVLPFMFQALFTVLWRTAFRAYYPHYLLSIILLLALVDFERLRDMFPLSGDSKKKPALAMACMAVVAALGMAGLFVDTAWKRAQRYEDYGSNIEQNVAAFDEMAQNPETAYLYPVSSPLLWANESYSIFHAFPEDYFINSKLLGGWDSRSPAWNDFKERYVISSLPLGVIDSSGVCLVSPELSLLTQYFQQEGKEVNYEDVMPLGDNLMAVRVIETP